MGGGGCHTPSSDGPASHTYLNMFKQYSCVSFTSYSEPSYKAFFQKYYRFSRPFSSPLHSISSIFNGTGVYRPEKLGARALPPPPPHTSLSSISQCPLDLPPQHIHAYVKANRQEKKNIPFLVCPSRRSKATQCPPPPRQNPSYILHCH